MEADYTETLTYEPEQKRLSPVESSIVVQDAAETVSASASEGRYSAWAGAATIPARRQVELVVGDA